MTQLIPIFIIAGQALAAGLLGGVTAYTATHGDWNAVVAAFLAGLTGKAIGHLQSSPFPVAAPAPPGSPQ